MTAHAPTGDSELTLDSALREIELLKQSLEDLTEARAREVHERTNAQEALASAKWALEAQNVALKDVDRAKDAFVANLAHELRTPLTSIVGHLELLADGTLSEEQRRFAATIQRNSAHLLKLIEDLLSTAHIRSGTVRLAIEQVDVSSLVADCVEDARPRAAAKQLELTYDPAEVILAAIDRTRIRQVVSNLVSNALKFAPAGGRVCVRVARVSDRVAIEVADNGPGISPADQAQVFERFYRTTSAAETPGTGLGLAIVKAIAEAHGGTASLESRPSAWTTFRIELPLVHGTDA